MVGDAGEKGATKKAATTKRRSGRPTKYRKTYPQTVKVQAEINAPFTDEQVAEMFGVDEQTVKNWYKRYPDFLASIKKAKAISDDKVERSLFERATGYSVPDVHVSNYEGSVTLTPIIKHYPPDPTAMIFWLKNRRPKVWRDKKELDLNVQSLADIAAIMRGARDGTTD
jgi:hypothetical protein